MGPVCEGSVPEGIEMDQDAPVTLLIDEALERFAARDLVQGSEVVDFLLDLRLALVAPMDELLEEQPVG